MEKSNDVRNEWEEKAIQLAQYWVDWHLRDYREPSREGLAKGQKIGLSLRKRRAAFLTGVLHDRKRLPLREIARIAEVKSGVLSVWRVEEDFRKAETEGCQLFGERIANTIFLDLLAEHRQYFLGIDALEAITKKYGNADLEALGTLSYDPPRRSADHLKVLEEFRDSPSLPTEAIKIVAVESPHWSMDPLMSVLPSYHANVFKPLALLTLRIKERSARNPDSETYLWLTVRLYKLQEKLRKASGRNPYQDPDLRGAIKRLHDDLVDQLAEVPPLGPVSGEVSSDKQDRWREMFYQGAIETRKQMAAFLKTLFEDVLSGQR